MNNETHEPGRNEDEQRQDAQENVTGPALSAASSRNTPNGGAEQSAETSRLQRVALGAGFTIRELVEESFGTSESLCDGALGSEES